MKGKVAVYTLGIGIIALAGAIFNHVAHGKPILLDRLPLVFLVMPVFGYLLWLRWDWAPEEGRRAREKRRRERERP